MAQFNTTELDFDKIKENIKTYFLSSSDSEYSDWDFEGSGLNTLLNVLAYNTHYNAMLAHMSMNESFLDSAQVRGNVVSRAKLLGYTPRSTRAATGEVTLTCVPSSSPADPTFAVPNYTQFKSTVDGVTYTFITLSDSSSAVLTNDQYIFNNLEIAQGTLKSETFYVDNSYTQRFIISDQNIDTSTLVVTVYPNLNRDEGFIYIPFTDFIGEGGSESQIYFLDENMDGFYEIRFGNDVFGKAPAATSLVEITYLSTDGDVANGATDFEWVSWGDDVSAIATVDSVVTTSNARSGSSREDITSIKFNAPLNFIAQRRAVTASDYYALLIQEITGIDSVIVWGGEDNDPINLGYVYICPKPTTGDVISEDQENDILAFLSNKGVIGINHIIVDPEYTYLYFEINYKYDPSITSKSVTTLNSQIAQVVKEYNDTVLRTFDGVFRHSNFVTAIDNSDKSVLNTTARINAYKEWTLTDLYPDGSPIDPSPYNYIVELDFGFKIDGTTEQTIGVITNSPTYIAFDSPYNTYTIVDKPWSDSTASPPLNQLSERPIFIESTDPSPDESIEVGYINLETGKIYMDLAGYAPDASPAPTIEIHIVPRSNDIAAKRAKILQIDSSKNTYYGEIDTAFTGSGNATYTTFDRE